MSDAQQRTIDEIRRRAAGSVGQYGGDVAFLLDALEGALASIRWRDALAEEWAAHMRTLTAENERMRKLLSRVSTLRHPSLSGGLGRDIAAALVTPPPVEHTYTRGPET